MDRTLIADALTTRDGKGDSIIHRELSFKNLDCMSESNETPDSFRICEATDGLIAYLKLMGEQRHIAAKVLSEKNKDGMTPLHMMALSLPESISHILAQYVNRCDLAHIMSIINNRGETPIHILCKEHHLVINSVVRCIPASQLSHLLSKQNFEGNTPLHLLAYHDDPINVEKLLVMIDDQHFNFALRNKQEATALHIACALQNIGTLSAIVNCTGTVRALALASLESNQKLDLREAVEIMCEESTGIHHVRATITLFDVHTRPCIPCILGNHAREDFADLVRQIADEDMHSVVSKIDDMTLEQLNEGRLIIAVHLMYT